MTCVHLVVPDGVDDLARPSGGNTYDRRLRTGLTDLGWRVRQHPVPGSWPVPDATSLAALAGVLGGVPAGEQVVVDGLLAAAAAVLVPAARRLRVVVLVHMPLGLDAGESRDLGLFAAERQVLRAAAAVVTTSAWTRDHLIQLHGLVAAHVRVAEPGVDQAEVAGGTSSGSSLLCVAAVSEHKGHAVLLEALASLRDLSWSCQVVGSLDRDPVFVALLRGRIDASGLGDRVLLAGALAGPALAASYAAADLLVLPSRAETYGMVITEALARGVPVLATSVGGVPQALGQASDGRRPGVLVPADDPAALADALRRWLGEPALRSQLRAAAVDRRTALSRWSVTARAVARVLTQVAA